MRILHCCLACFYNEDYNYQENLLPRQNKRDGHEVWILASTEVFLENRYMGYTEPQTYVNKDGIKVIRVPYRKVLTDRISHKIRMYNGVYSVLEEFQPDVILFHGMGAGELLTIGKYVKTHKATRLYIDNHANYINSAKNKFSLHVLHKLYYGGIIRHVLPYIKEVLCIGFREMEFAEKVYKVPKNKIKYYPLGGYILSDEEYQHRREKTRRELGISENELVFCHSGKMDKVKLTDQLVTEFQKIHHEGWHLLIAGSLLDDIKETVQQAISQDKRIRFLGWKNADELVDLLCATDVYMQPGSSSATLQYAMCCRCVVMAKPIKEYCFLLQDYGLFVESGREIGRILEKFAGDEIDIAFNSKETLERAKELLDYQRLAAEIY